MTKEIWKDIKDYEGLYWISNLGRVKNKHDRILQPEYSNKGYACVILRKNNKNTKKRVHRLVAETFLPNPSSLPCVNHIDENKANNNVNNLEWCTHFQNMKAYSKCHPNHPYALRAVYCFDLDKDFESIAEAAIYTGICRTSITRACQGKQHSAGGKLWCYAKDKHVKFSR